jgi:YVTN family beta-propeller protein
LEYELLGTLEVRREGRRLELGAMRQRAVLAILLINRGSVVATDRLADELWGERPPASAAKAVQVYVSRLRKILGPDALITHGQGYMLASEAEVDVDRFQSLLAAGRSALTAADPDTASRALREALALWRGPPLADFTYESFAQAEIARLGELRLDAIEDRVEADLRLGHTRELVGELEALVAEHPNREHFLSQLMLALYRGGRQQDALAAYRLGRESLRERLGLEPSPELGELERRILNHDAALELSMDDGRAPRPTAARRGRLRALIATAAVLALSAVIAAGVLWLAGSGGSTLAGTPNSLVAIGLRDDRVEGSVPVGADPDAIALGAGSVWVANLDDETVSRVDPATMKTLRTLPVGGPPDGIAAAGGAIWVAESSARSSSVSVRRIDAQFNSVENTVELANLVPGSKVAIAGRRGPLWVAPFSGQLTALDPSSGRVLRRIDPGVAPIAVDAGAGAVWVADDEADYVARFSTRGSSYSIPVGHVPNAIAVGAGGVWVADTGDGTVERIDPKKRAVVARIRVGAEPSGIAVGGGSVWVADSGDGTVMRIDPASDRVVARIAVGASPRAIVIGDGRAWVAVDAATLPPLKGAAGGATARLDAASDVTSMDPALANDQLSWQLLYATCAKLLNYPDGARPGSAGLVPEVARALPTPSADGRIYTFTIRRGFRFSPPSNAPVTALTFKDAIERSLDPKMKSPLAREFADITGADAYMAGRAAHISGLSVQGEQLTIRLREPSPDILARLAEPAACAVPSDTPVDPDGVHAIPSAGPFSVASYTPGRGIVLTRNPNYHQSRPHSLERIEVAVAIPGERAVEEVESGRADYALNGEIGGTAARALDAHYGAASPAARAGREQYFVNAYPNLSFLALNSRRPLFASARLRRALNYAVNRSALAQLGEQGSSFPETPIDHYLPAGVPGHRDVHVYPVSGDLTTARRLAAGDRGAIATLYTCESPSCERRARMIAAEMSAIGVRVHVDRFPDVTLYKKIATPGAPFDIATLEWAPRFIDPEAMLNFLLESRQLVPSLDDHEVADHLAAAARLSGRKRFLAYSRLDAEIARAAAPLVAYGVASAHELFSTRMGCERYGVFGYDIAALCVRHGGG